MPSLKHTLLARSARRVPGLRRLPVLRLLAIGEVALLAREHLSRLQPSERRRLFDLVRKGRGRTSGLSGEEREELARLVAKAEPRRFAALAADKLSPVPLPRSLLDGVSGARRR